MDARADIENLMATYTYVYDHGDLEAYADLFAHGTVSGMSTHGEIVAFHKDNTYAYDGEPRTRHVVSNIHINVDEDAGTADSRSYVIVYQAVPDFPLQPILTGSYRDKFKRLNGEWVFADRRFEDHLTGDTSRCARPGMKLPDAEASLIQG